MFVKSSFKSDTSSTTNGSVVVRVVMLVEVVLVARIVIIVRVVLPMSAVIVVLVV